MQNALPQQPAEGQVNERGNKPREYSLSRESRSYTKRLDTLATKLHESTLHTANAISAGAHANFRHAHHQQQKCAISASVLMLSILHILHCICSCSQPGMAGSVTHYSMMPSATGLLRHYRCCHFLAHSVKLNSMADCHQCSWKVKSEHH